MPANLITRQISSRVFLQILNTSQFLRLFQALSTEYVAEYDIANNTLRVKLIDKLKLEKLKRGQLKKPRNLTADRFAVGRFNSIQILSAINLLNNNPSLKARFGLKAAERIQRLQAYGSTSVVVYAYNQNEVRNDQEQQQIENRSNFGVNVQSPRGSR